MTDYKTKIDKIGIRKTRIAKALNIRPDLLSRYINGKEPMPLKHQHHLDEILDKLQKSTNKILTPKTK